MSSFLRFSEQRCGLQIIKNFSLKHKLQRLVSLEYDLAREIIFHEILKSILLALSVHIYLLSSVEFFKF